MYQKRETFLIQKVCESVMTRIPSGESSHPIHIYSIKWKCHHPTQKVCESVTTLSISVAGCCSVLQCVAVRCSALQCTVICYRVLQCVAVWKCVKVSRHFQFPLQGVAVCCSVLQCVAVYCDMLQGVAVCCSVKVCESFTTLSIFVAVCCSVWKCVKVCESVMTRIPSGESSHPIHIYSIKWKCHYPTQKVCESVTTLPIFVIWGGFGQ